MEAVGVSRTSDQVIRSLLISAGCGYLTIVNKATKRQGYTTHMTQPREPGLARG